MQIPSRDTTETELFAPAPPPASPARALTAAEFRALAAVPPELEWFANLPNLRTRRAYPQDVRDFTAFVGIGRPEEFRTVTRAHLIAWRQDLEARNLAPSSIRRKLAALASLFDYLCERNAVAHNPADGVKRPRANHHEGLTMPKRGPCWRRHLPPRSKASETGRSWLRCCITACAGKNYAD